MCGFKLLRSAKNGCVRFLNCEGPQTLNMRPQVIGDWEGGWGGEEKAHVLSIAGTRWLRVKEEGHRKNFKVHRIIGCKRAGNSGPEAAFERTMWMSTIGDPRENKPMPKAEGGGKHRRRVFLAYNFNVDSRLFWWRFQIILEYGHRVRCGSQPL